MGSALDSEDVNSQCQDMLGLHAPNALYVLPMSCPLKSLNVNFVLGRALDYQTQLDNYVAKIKELRAFKMASEGWVAMS